MKKAVFAAALSVFLGVIVFLAALPSGGFDLSFTASGLYLSEQAASAYYDRDAALYGEQIDGGSFYTGPLVESGAFDLDPGDYAFTVKGTFEGAVRLELYSPQYADSDNNRGRVFASADFEPTSGSIILSASNDEVIRGARLRIVRLGDGVISIRGIAGEGSAYSDAYVLAALTAVAAVLAMLFLSRHENELRRGEFGSAAAVFCCVLVAVISTAPLARQSLPYAHDLSFHLTRIDGIADGLRSGQFPVRLNPTFLAGYGYADATMYPAAFLYFPAVLRLLGVSTIVTYQLFVFAINLLTAALSYFCFKRLFRRRDLAIFASVAYTLCLYRLICVFTRAAVGELLAMAFLPAVLLGMYEVFFGDAGRLGNRWLIIGFLGLINCHVLSFEIAAIFCLLFFLFNLRRMREPSRLYSLAVSAGIVTVLSLWIIVPMVDLMRDKMFATSYKRTVSEDAVYPFELFATFVSSNGLSGDRSVSYTGMPLTVGGILALGALLFIFLQLFYKADDDESRRLGAIGFGSLKLGLLALLVASTLFPWAVVADIPYLGDFLSSIQFPWRYLGVASLMLAVVLTIAAGRLGGLTRHRRLVLFFCAAAVALCCSPYLDGYMQNSAQGTMLSKKHTPLSTFYVGGQEYMHTGTSKSALESRGPAITAENAQIEGMSKRYLTVGFDYSGASGDSFAELPLYYYNGYRAFDSDGGALTVKAGTNGVVRVLLPHGSGSVTVGYFPPVSYRISEGISLIAALLLLSECLLSRRKERYGKISAAQ